MQQNQKVYKMIVSALLCAVGIIIPLFAPKIYLGVMSFTLASHVAIFIAMFISPASAIFVSLGTTLGFLLTLPLPVVIRALSHVIFATIGSLILKKRPEILNSVGKNAVFCLGIAIIHGICESLVSIPFFFSGQMQGSFLEAVIVTVGAGTVVHSCIDYIIAILIWQPLKKTFRHNVTPTASASA